MLQALLADRFQLKVHKASAQTQSYALIVGPKGPKFQRKILVSDPPAPPPAGPEISVTTKGGDTAATSNGTTRTILAGGGPRIETSTIAGLAKNLTLDLPVVDKTNLTGEFNIVFEIHSGITASQTLDEMTEAHTEAVMAAVETLGLKLVRQKNSIETIVVDSVNRTRKCQQFCVNAIPVHMVHAARAASRRPG
jgi:uncharacterized protein (TIGR03435 family)